MTITLQHFVPQFYLKRFVGADGLLWVYDKDHGRVFSANPRNLAAERGFYDLPEGFPDSSLMEQQLSALEHEAALITEDWLSHLVPGNYVEIPDVNREIMSLYITIQLLRTSEAREILAQSVSSTQTTPLEEEVRKGFHLGMLWDEETVKKISDWAYDCTWAFRINVLAESLYTSDDPVKVRNTTQHLHWAQTSVAGAYLLMPLTPRVMMYCFGSQDWSKLKQFDRHILDKPLEAELVKSANVHQVGHARRFVFSDQDGFALAREFCAEFPGAVGQNRDRFSGESG